MDNLETKNRRFRLSELLNAHYPGEGGQKELLDYIHKRTGKRPNQGELSGLLKTKSFGQKKGIALSEQIGLNRNWFEMPAGTNLNKDEWLHDYVMQNETAYAEIDLMNTKLSAGTGNLVYYHDSNKKIAFRFEYLKSAGVKPENAKGFPVKGDSMIDVHITDGSIVAIDISKTTPKKGKYFAIWIGHEYLIKELVKIDAIWIARSHNKEKAKSYPDILINEEQSGIIGQAFWCGFKL